MYYTIGYISKMQNDGNTAADAMRAAVNLRFDRNAIDAPRDDAHAARRLIGAAALGATSKEAMSAPMCAFLLNNNEIARTSHKFAPLLLAQFIAYASGTAIDVVIAPDDNNVVPTSQVNHDQQYLTMTALRNNTNTTRRCTITCTDRSSSRQRICMIS
jgi:hypothetical protein